MSDRREQWKEEMDEWMEQWREEQQRRREEMRRLDSEVEAIDWDEPNEENGFYPGGRSGCVWWVQERKRSRTDIVVEHLTSQNARLFMELPTANPLAHILTGEEWMEVRARVERKYDKRAVDFIEGFYKEAKFGEGKDLETGVGNTRREDAQEYAQTLRLAAVGFAEIAKGLEWGASLDPTSPTGTERRNSDGV